MTEKNMQTLAQLDTLIAISPESLPRCGSYAARRAVSRLAQAAAADPTSVPAAGALERYERLRSDVPTGSYYDEHIYLRRALALAPLPAVVLDRIRLGAQTLADAAQAIERQAKLSEDGRVVGALKRFASRLGVALDQIPATEVFVERHLETCSHTYLGITRQNFDNWRARVRRAIRLVDLQARQDLKLSQLAGPWQILFTPLAKPRKGQADARTPAQKKAAANQGKIWPLVTHAYRHGILPEAVDDSTVQGALAALESRRRIEPFAVMREAVYGWERMQALLDGFPRQKLSRLYASGRGPHATAFDDLPPQLLQSWQDYVDRFFGENGMPKSFADLVEGDDEDEDELLDFSGIDEETRPSLRKASTLANFRTIVSYAANASAAAGENATTLGEIMTRTNLERVLQAIRARQRQRAGATAKNNYLYGAATMFIAMAKDHGTDEHVLEIMRRIRDRVDPYLIRLEKSKKTGNFVRVREDFRMGPRHAERLRAFNEPAVVDAWFTLPYELVARAEKVVASKRTPTFEEINDLIVAILHLMDRCGPTRRQNKAALRFRGNQAHFMLPEHEGAEVRIHIPAAETKNRNSIDMVWPKEVAAIVRLYLKHYRPALARAVGADAENPCLFPAKGMRHRSGTALNRIFVHRNWKYGGFLLNMHCQRHLAAKLILDADTSQMSLVQALLGHKNLQTTSMYYGKVNQIIAQRTFQDMLAQHHAQRYGCAREAA